jgi:hypothetical protein
MGEGTLVMLGLLSLCRNFFVSHSQMLHSFKSMMNSRKAKEIQILKS